MMENMMGGSMVWMLVGSLIWITVGAFIFSLIFWLTHNWLVDCKKKSK